MSIELIGLFVVIIVGNIVAFWGLIRLAYPKEQDKPKEQKPKLVEKPRTEKAQQKQREQYLEEVSELEKELREMYP